MVKLLVAEVRGRRRWRRGESRPAKMKAGAPRGWTGAVDMRSAAGRAGKPWKDKTRAMLLPLLDRDAKGWREVGNVWLHGCPRLCCVPLLSAGWSSGQTVCSGPPDTKTHRREEPSRCRAVTVPASRPRKPGRQEVAALPTRVDQRPPSSLPPPLPLQHVWLHVVCPTDRRRPRRRPARGADASRWQPALTRPPREPDARPSRQRRRGHHRPRRVKLYVALLSHLARSQSPARCRSVVRRMVLFL